MTQPTARTEESVGPVDAAPEQASNVSEHAGEKGSQLGTAADQAKHVTAEAGRQARDLIAEARGQPRCPGLGSATESRQQAEVIGERVDLDGRERRTVRTSH